MKSKSCITGFIVALILSSISYYLLDSEKLSGGEFVAFTLGILFIGLSIAALPEISELSIAGNKIKLREVRLEGEQTVEALKDSLKSSFKIQLAFSKNMSGGFGSSAAAAKDERIDIFWSIYTAITGQNFNDSLSTEICGTADVILQGQLNTIQNLNENIRRHISLDMVDVELPNKNQLTIWAMDEASLQKAANRHEKDLDEFKLIVLESLEEYGKLLEVRNKYNTEQTIKCKG